MSQPATLEKVLYTANATATGGRDGRIKSDDGVLDMPLTIPKGLGGSGAPGANPEELFAAGYSACFASAIGHVARAQKIKTGTVVVSAKVSIGPVGQAFGLAVELTASIPDVTPEQGQKLLETAHQVCPYSNATRGNIVVEIKLAS
ncbi:MAG: organic hydroperoxide resistance protein [Labilithrix sp.]